MKKLVPLAKAQKIEYNTILKFPERTEIVRGKLLWSDEEIRSVILGVLTNTGLEFLVSILPKESLNELRNMLSEYDDNSSR